MKRSTILMMIVAAALLTLACARNESGSGAEQTGTVKRAEPQPGEIRPEELTQTVELDDGRSVDEGASIIEPEPDVTTGTTTTTATTTTTTTRANPPRTPPPPRKP